MLCLVYIRNAFSNYWLDIAVRRTISHAALAVYPNSWLICHVPCTFPTINSFVRKYPSISALKAS